MRVISMRNGGNRHSMMSIMALLIGVSGLLSSSSVPASRLKSLFPQHSSISYAAHRIEASRNEITRPLR